MLFAQSSFSRYRPWSLALIMLALATLSATAEDAPAAAPSQAAEPAPTEPPKMVQSPMALRTPDGTQLRSTEPAPATNGNADGKTDPTPVVVAETGPAPAPAPAAAPLPSSTPGTPSAMADLVNILVSKNIISQDQGDKLVKRSNEELDNARAQAASTQAAADRALAVAQIPPAAPAPTTSSQAGNDEEEVTYVPDVVKQQITDQVTQNVLKATDEKEIAVADQTPDWVKRFRVSGDIRTRAQWDLVPSGNAVGNFTNFNSINTGQGFNINTPTPSLPQYNVDQNRNLYRLRARIGADIDLGQGFTSGLRIATGSDDSPVSENQTLGAANGTQGGNFGKYQIWLDRAFIRYELGAQPDKDLTFTVGRFDNPFFHTSMLWSEDVAFDGLAVAGKYQMAPGVTPFFAAGAFPVFNTDLNFSTNQAQKFSSEDKYLLAGQLGTNWQISKDFSAKVAATYYYFDNIQGKVSDPILLASANAVGNTDDSRPSFAQNGNTYIALRDFEDPAPGANPEYQYYGLATPFHDFALTGQLDYSGFDPFHLWLTGEFVENLAFNRNAIINGGPPSDPGPQNNTTSADPNSFVGGNIGYDASLHAGKVSLEHLWDWNVYFGYRHVESDATVDAFTDTNFGGILAGTNLKGYMVGANLAFTPRVFMSVRYFSADAVAGPTYKSDVLQLDLNAKF